MIYLLGIITTFIMVFGMEGRGVWSRNISIIGGWLWFASVIFAFYSTDWKTGILFVLSTFILGAILKEIFKPLLNPKGRPGHRY